MKVKKLSLAMIFLAITIVAYTVASVLFCYETKPEVRNGEFPFSITYEYKGETETISGVYECEFYGSETIHNIHERHWGGELKYENPKYPENPHVIEQNDELQTTLAVQPNMYAGYFMGDPLHKYYYEEYNDGVVEPYVEYYDYKNDITLNDENKEEVLESIGFKIVDFTYGEPIENSFSFSGISYEADNVVIFVTISLVFLLLCLIFVRKDKEYSYSSLDKVGIILNFVVGIAVLPFITLICILAGLVESSVEIINQITYNIPSISIICLAFSIVLRRKGFSKIGFFIQFIGPLMFALLLLSDIFV